MIGFAFGNDFAYDFVEVSIFSTLFKQACPAARTESLFSLVTKEEEDSHSFMYEIVRIKLFILSFTMCLKIMLNA